MRRPICICAVLLLLSSTCYGAVGRTDVSKVRFEITWASKTDRLVHWKISNNSDVEVYVYDVFLLGPAYTTEHRTGMVTFDTTPVDMLASCPPNRFLPVLLMVVRSGGTIEGDFSDAEVEKLTPGTRISLKIAVGSEPDSVIAEWLRFLSSDCKHSPYDAIVRWGTILESNSIQVSSR
jgi:hypothetical protein